MTLPPSLPVSSLVQTLRYLREPYELLEECQQKLGDIFRIRILSLADWVFVASPELIKEMFMGPADQMHAGEANDALFGTLIGKSTIFTLDGARHARQRKVIQPPLHGERLQVYCDIMREITEEEISRWPRDGTFSMHDKMQHIALQVILRAIFGLEHGARASELRVLLNRLADIGLASPLLLLPPLQIDLGRYSPWGKVVRLREDTDRALYAEIAARRAGANNAREDILSLLLMVKGEDGEPITDKELRDELITMLLAGHETTATSLAWVFERVLSLPDVYEKLVAEIDSVVGEATIGREHLAKLEYTDAVIKEALRIRPIMPIAATRVVKRETEIGGYTLPEGIRVTSCHYLAHLRPETYAEPKAFKPERFLGTKPDPFEWVLFGGGVRRCIGAAFASFEMKIVVATVIQKMKLRLPEPSTRVRRGVFTAPAQGLPVEIEKLRQAI